MTAFQIISILTFLALGGGIAYQLRMRHDNWNAVRDFHLYWIDRVRGILGRAPLRKRAGDKFSDVRILLYLCSLALATILGLTGFIPVVFLGEHMSGVLLVLHVTVAPLFALALAGLAMLWAHRMRFVKSDGRSSEQLIRRKALQKGAMYQLLVKLGFWIALICSIPLILSIILELYPLFGTDGLKCLTSIHGYSALVLLVIIIVQMYVVMNQARRLPVESTKEEQL